MVFVLQITEGEPDLALLPTKQASAVMLVTELWPHDRSSVSRKDKEELLRATKLLPYAYVRDGDELLAKEDGWNEC